MNARKFSAVFLLAGSCLACAKTEEREPGLVQPEEWWSVLRRYRFQGFDVLIRTEDVKKTPDRRGDKRKASRS